MRWTSSFAPPPIPLDIMRASGLEPDDWQEDVLDRRPHRGLILCSRQSGKSTVGACMALDTALSIPRSTSLLVSPSLRQSSEIQQKVRDLLEPLSGQPGIASAKPMSETILSLKLANRSRILSLPASETTIRGFSAQTVIFDEAGWVDDSLVHTVMPMLAATNGRLVALTTPRSRRGWFYDQWHNGNPDWYRARVTAEECPRITTAYLDEQRASMPARVFNAEFNVSFEDAVGAVFKSADIDACFGIEREAG